jgi:aminoglycoside phosphotransferase (APT) family kinase protein
MHQSVETALDAAFPDRTVVDVGGAGPSWNGGNETVAVVFADGCRAYLKTAVDGAGSRLDREVATLAYLRAHRPLPVPATLAVETSGPVPYLATAPAPGQSVDERFEPAGPDTRERLLRRVGRAVAALHAVRFDGHGTIRGRGVTVGCGETVGRGTPAESNDAVESTFTRPGLEVSIAPWPDVLLETVEQTREIATTDRLDRHFDAVAGCIERHRQLLAGAPAALLHGDVTKPNAFVVDGRRDAHTGDVGLLDWELAHVGDPSRDLVRARDQLCNGFDTEGPDRLTDAVLDGYRDRAGGLPAGFEVREPIYRVVRVLGRSGFLDQWVSYLGEPMEALVDRIDAELDSRLAAVRRATDE